VRTTVGSFMHKFLEEGVAPVSGWDYLIIFGFYSCLVHYPCLAIDCYRYSSLSRSRCSEGCFGLWLGDKGIVNGKTSTIFHILIVITEPRPLPTTHMGPHRVTHIIPFLVQHTLSHPHMDITRQGLISSNLPLFNTFKILNN
jgi:hypothetical protein